MPTKDPIKRNAQTALRKQRLKKRRIEAGLCVKCSEPRSKESLLCEKHRKKENERIRNTRLRKIENNICAKCENLAEFGHKHCSDCLLKYRELNKLKECLDCHKRAREGQLRCSFHAKRANQRTKEYQARHKQEGLCRVCSNPVMKNKTACELHVKKDKEYKINRKLKGLCPHCGSNPCAEGRTKCENCLEKDRQYTYKHGSLPKEKIKQLRYQKSIRFMKEESPILAEHWDEVKDWIQEHAEVFYDKVDPVLFNTAMTLEEYEGEINKEKDY